MSLIEASNVFPNGFVGVIGAGAGMNQAHHFRSGNQMKTLRNDIGDLGGGRRSLTPSGEAPRPDDQQGTGDAAES